MEKGEAQSGFQQAVVLRVRRAVPKYSQSMACELPLGGSRLESCSMDKPSGACEMEDIETNVNA